MPYLVDTNVLLRSVDISHPMNPNAVNAIRTLRDRGEQFHIVPQNLIEFWNVYTRPTERNGLGRSVAETQSEVNHLNVLFPLLLWLKSQQHRYDFKHHVSEQRLIKNLIEAYTNIADKDAYLNQRLDRLTKDLEISKEQLANKRCEHDAANQTVLVLKQQKAMLKSELSI